MERYQNSKVKLTFSSNPVYDSGDWSSGMRLFHNNNCQYQQVVQNLINWFGLLQADSNLDWISVDRRSQQQAVSSLTELSYLWMQNTDGQIEDYSWRYKKFLKYNLNNHFLKVFSKSLLGILRYQHLSALDAKYRWPNRRLFMAI